MVSWWVRVLILISHSIGFNGGWRELGDGLPGRNWGIQFRNFKKPKEGELDGRIGGRNFSELILLQIFLGKFPIPLQETFFQLGFQFLPKGGIRVWERKEGNYPFTKTKGNHFGLGTAIGLAPSLGGRQELAPPFFKFPQGLNWDLSRWRNLAEWLRIAHLG